MGGGGGVATRDTEPYIYIYIPPPKFNSSPLKSYRNPIGKANVFQPPFFRGKLAVKLRGSRYCPTKMQTLTSPLTLPSWNEPLANYDGILSDREVQGWTAMKVILLMAEIRRAPVEVGSFSHYL